MNCEYASPMDGMGYARQSQMFNDPKPFSTSSPHSAKVLVLPGVQNTKREVDRPSEWRMWRKKRDESCQ